MKQRHPSLFNLKLCPRCVFRGGQIHSSRSNLPKQERDNQLIIGFNNKLSISCCWEKTWSCWKTPPTPPNHQPFLNIYILKRWSYMLDKRPWILAVIFYRSTGLPTAPCWPCFWILCLHGTGLWSSLKRPSEELSQGISSLWVDKGSKGYVDASTPFFWVPSLEVATD